MSYQHLEECHLILYANQEAGVLTQHKNDESQRRPDERDDLMQKTYNIVICVSIYIMGSTKIMVINSDKRSVQRSTEEVCMN